MKQKFPRLFLYLLGALFLLNLFQSFFTELIYDEAYYWYYAQNLDWGYFDHPPMVAFLIKLSSFFFDGELGVRLMSCVLGVGTACILWAIIDNGRKKDYIVHFFLLLFALPLLNVYGFFTLPDTPLLFFTALFLLVYKHFLNSPSIRNTILLGLTMACLMYSKYHAVLVIFFVLLSNLKLLKNKHAWLAVIVSLLAYLPHFLWLYENDFVTIKYHLFERPNQPYSFEGFTLGYLLNLIVNFGLLFPFAYWALFKKKASTKFDKALLYLSYGIILFFFLSSFQRRTQTQWVIVICIPMILLTYEYLLNQAKSRKWMYRLGIVSFFLLIFGRIGLAYEPLFPVVFETHGNKEWVNKVKSEVGDMPIVFENSYRRSPMYQFYSGGITTFSLNNVHYRQNQYTIDNSEEAVQGKKIAYISLYMNKGDFEYQDIKGGEFKGIYIDEFESFRKLQCYTDNEPIKLSAKDMVLKVYNPYDIDISLEKLKFRVGYLNSYKQLKETLAIKYQPLEAHTKALNAKDTTKFKFSLPNSNLEDLKYLKFSISENGLQPGINSETYKVER
ncbi:hypothetical protein MTsPCn9_18870 [Croceitalea sp. MTPC9]|uniref:ArnT family glycosyltransferase n=1 Tax=unclassified Croceitalea TaxID=2632280 RepID=UPI002B390825|nr:hypothetical protein MTsPCn6_11720 [Croceitalea sp. MTPC6]GMN16951.1 hypothetical protein MTsPCn9_18870 [Croceitalea sp. MTPC9]